MRNIVYALLLLFSAKISAETRVFILEVNYVNSINDIPFNKLGASYMAGNNCKIWALTPESFEDHAALEVVGHELHHCMRGPEIHKEDIINTYNR